MPWQRETVALGGMAVQLAEVTREYGLRVAAWADADARYEFWGSPSLTVTRAQFLQMVGAVVPQRR